MIWQILIGLVAVIAVGIALFAGFIFLLAKVIPLLVTGMVWLGRLVLHFVDWVATTILLPLCLLGFGGDWMRSYFIAMLVLALLSTLRVIRGGRYNLGFVLSPLLLALGALGAATGAADGRIGSCGGEYTGLEEGADPSASWDDFGRSIGARYVANKRSKVVFDVSDPAAKTVSFKNRKYMDDLPYNLDDRGYRMKRDG